MAQVVDENSALLTDKTNNVTAPKNHEEHNPKHVYTTFEMSPTVEDQHTRSRTGSRNLLPTSQSPGDQLADSRLVGSQGDDSPRYGANVENLKASRRRQSQQSSQSQQPPRLRRTSYATRDPVGGKSSLYEKPAVDTKPLIGALPRPVGGSFKLGTFDGVFVPTTLNVLSILMFLRFGFILGQSGVFGMMGMLIACYFINLVTTMSISAIATNGTVRGGGAYYLISRSLGPEFGGSIGLVFYLGFTFNTGMNAVGLIDCLTQNFGMQSGNWSTWLPEGYWWQYLWATLILILCTGICLLGSGLFARCSNGLLVVLLIATLSIPISTIFVYPFENTSLGINYTGLSFRTFAENLKPHFTKGAAGSQLRGRETYQDLFGILFPATGGIFAGASMSGDLKNPSRSIPQGTLYGLAVTFGLYSLVIFAMAGSITRASLQHDVNVIQDTNISSVLVLLGEFATCFFSALMGVIGSAKLLQALARDQLLPGLSVFGQGTKKNDEPIYAILVTYAVAQITMLANINRIASFITMTYLMTFLVTNLACFLLVVSAAPNFRPSFHYFNWTTAALGAILSGASMFFVDGVYASASVGILVLLFLVIHYTTLPKAWGDVSQGLIYHQVRKYLLRLRQEHVKFWRPQILLFVNDPRRSYKLILFCNSLKKGALFVLGHVIVTQDFASAVPEAKKQQVSWMKYIDFSKIKAFVNVAISPGIEWGTRNVVLSAGLGGMKPNIVVLGFYNLEEQKISMNRNTQGPAAGLAQTTTLESLFDRSSTGDVAISSASQTGNAADSGTVIHRRSQRRRSQDDRMQGVLPTDANRTEKAVGAKNYVTILEDLVLRLQINVAIAKGFSELELPASQGGLIQRALSYLHLHREQRDRNTKSYIDLWPIQMSAEIATDGEETDSNMLTTNFDTYTLILQLGCILHTVSSWNKAYSLRVIVFVEYESDVEEEQGRVETLLSSLRIEAEVLVLWLASGQLKSYEIIINGNCSKDSTEVKTIIDGALKEEDWWQEVTKARNSESDENHAEDLNTDRSGNPISGLEASPLGSFQISKLRSLSRKLRRNQDRRPSISHLSKFGVSITMQTHRLDPRLIEKHQEAGNHSASDDSETSSVTESDSNQSQINSGDDDISQSTKSDTILKSSNLEDFKFRDKTSTASSPAPLTMHRNSSAEAVAFPPQPDSPDRISSFRDSYFDNLSIERIHTAPAATKSILPAPYARPLPRHLQTDLRRPPTIRHQSYPRLTSTLVPRTTVAAEEGAGPSIMFSTPSPPARISRNPLQSIYDRYTEDISPNDKKDTRDSRANQSTRKSSAQSANSGTSSARGSISAASGYPSSTAQPLSFNTLPCRAQHLIINELMMQHSGGSGERQTAVIFTTLPAPAAGTSDSEEDSLWYLGDLETLCRGLPPVLMVHSNSMSVTTSL